MWKPERKRPLGRPRGGWEDNMGRGEAYTGFWCGNMRVRDRWGDPGVDGRIICGGERLIQGFGVET
jgi:hypothetical protein